MSDFKHLTEAVGELDEDLVLKTLEDFVSTNPSKEEGFKAVNACQEGMNIVGEKFESGEYFVGDLIFSGELLSQAIDILKPVTGSAKQKKLGSIVLGTVHGDLHDIGKNIFKSMAEAAGYKVYDLGIDQPAENFVSKVREVKPEIVGMSGLLTLAIDALKETVESLDNDGLRDNVKIIIGGNPMSEEICEYVGADAWTVNAAEGVKICQDWVS